MAGFQSFREFTERGPIKEMPPEIEAAVRAAVAGREEEHRVVVRISGEAPDEIHMTFHGQREIKRGTAVVFDGDLPPGTYKTSGILLYPGADAQGRRRSRTFDQTIEVTGPRVVEVGELKPRFND